MALDLALEVFAHVEGADHAYADVRDSVGDHLSTEAAQALEAAVAGRPRGASSAAPDG